VELVGGFCQPKMIAQRGALIFRTEQAAPLQFWNNLRHELFGAAWHLGQHDEKPSAPCPLTAASVSAMIGTMPGSTLTACGERPTAATCALNSAQNTRAFSSVDCTGKITSALRAAKAWTRRKRRPGSAPDGPAAAARNPAGPLPETRDRGDRRSESCWGWLRKRRPEGTVQFISSDVEAGRMDG
jgi:hypothetical protein